MIKPDYLKHIPLFSGFAEKEVRALAKIASLKRYPKETTIFKEGQAGEALFVINRGKVVIEKQPLLKGTAAITTLLIEEGGFFGELSLFGAGRRSSTARTQEEAEFIIFKKDSFLKLLKAKPSLASKLFLALIKAIGPRIQQTNQELIAFYETGRLLGASRQADKLLESLLEILVRSTQAGRGVIFTQNPATGFLEPRAVRGYERVVLKEIGLEQERGIAGCVIKRGEPVLIKDLFRDPDFKGLSREGYEQRAMLLVPLGIKENIKGLIILGGRKQALSGDSFTENDLNLVIAISKQASAALENIELHRAEEDRAKIKREYLRL